MQEGAEGPGKQWVRKKPREGGPAAREAPAVASEAQLHQQLTVPSPRFGCHARGREAARLLLGFLREAALRPHSKLREAARPTGTRYPIILFKGSLKHKGTGGL